MYSKNIWHRVKLVVMEDIPFFVQISLLLKAVTSSDAEDFKKVIKECDNWKFKGARYVYNMHGTRIGTER
jgi:hypothetical protein